MMATMTTSCSCSAQRSIYACPGTQISVPRPCRLPRRRVTGPVCFRENEQAESVEQKVERKVSHTTKQVATKVSGFLSSPDTQARAYWALGTAALATSSLLLAVPGQFAGFMFGAVTDPVVNSMLRAVGATLLTTATVKYTLKEAAVRGQLYMGTFQRLNIGLVVQTAASIILLAQAVSLRNNLLMGYMGAVCGTGLLVASRIYSLNKEGFPFPSLKRTFSAVLGVLMPRNWQAAAYSLLTVAFAGMAAMCLGAAPGGELRLYEGLHGPMTVFAQRAAGAGMMLMTIVAYSLKDGADRGKLGAMSFRWLNLGLAGSLMAMIWYMVVDWESGLLLHSSKATGMMASMIASFMYTGYMYVGGTSTPKAESV